MQHLPAAIRRKSPIRLIKMSTGMALTVSVGLLTLLWVLIGDVGFLGRPTGWQMGFSIMPQASTDPFWYTISLALINTLLMSFLAIILATIIGALMAITAVGGNPIWSRLARAYIQAFRNVPLLLQAFFWFAVLTHGPRPREAYWFLGSYVSNRGLNMAFPTLTGLAVGIVLVATFLLAFVALTRLSVSIARRIGFSAISAILVAVIVAMATRSPLISFPELKGFNFRGGTMIPTEFLALLIALTIFGSAYIAEIVRGGFATVPVGVIEAARATALPRWVIELKVRIPVALRAILLPLGSQYTILIKATSLGLAVGFTDLFAVTLTSINHSGQTVTLLLVMTLCYFAINQLVVSIFNVLNSAIEVPGHGSSGKNGA